MAKGNVRKKHFEKGPLSLKPYGPYLTFRKLKALKTGNEASCYYFSAQLAG